MHFVLNPPPGAETPYDPTMLIVAIVGMTLLIGVVILLGWASRRL